MRYIRTKFATGYGDQDDTPKSFFGRITEALNPNPDYDLTQVVEWLVEFDDDELPFREIGLAENGEPVLAGPNERNYGFWLDTNARYGDLDGTEITVEQFETKWKAFSTRGDSFDSPDKK